jgi:hypothetical protein
VENIRNAISRTTWIKLFLFILILHAFFRLIGPSSYLVNDDIAIVAFLDGSFTGNPEPNSIFTSPIFSQAISYLYLQIPALPWYPIALLVLVSVPVVVATNLIKTSELNWIYFIPFAMSVNIITTLPSFTLAALLGSFISGFIILKGVFANGRNIQLIVFGAVFFTLSSLVRFDAFLLGTAMLAPLFFLMVTKSGARFGLVNFTVLVSIAIPAFVMQAQFQTSCSNGTECVEWVEYNEHNLIRGTFHGSPRLELLRESSSEIGWSENDFLLFGNFMYPDEETFGLSSLLLADSVTPKLHPLSQVLKNPITSVADTLAKLRQTSSLMIFMFVVLVFSCLRSGKKLILLTFTAIGTLNWLALSTLAGVIRLPERLTIPMAIAQCIVVIAILDNSSVENFGRAGYRARHRRELASLNSIPRFNFQKNRNLVGFSCIAVILVIWINLPFGLNHRDDIQRNLDYASVAQSELVVASQSWNILLNPTLSNALNTNPWSGSRPFEEIRGMTMGWGTFSPLQEERKDMLGINSLFGDFIDPRSLRPQYSFCGSPEQANQISIFLNEFFISNVESKIAGSVPNVCVLYAFE